MEDLQDVGSEDESEFEDAEENVVPASSMDLPASIEDATRAVHLFFNNNFLDARMALEPWAHSSMYHAVGISVFEFLEAVLTFEPEQIGKASKALHHSLSVCNKFRHKSSLAKSIGKMVRKTNYDSYTMVQVHAELCYAEVLLLKAFLSFIEDETLSSFIKSGLKIRSCFNMYKVCQVILKTRKWDDDKMKTHFESGVRMGIGTFNLMISLLPSRVIKLLEFIGFSGSKNLGLRELELGYSLKHGIRQVMSVMTLLGYHLFATYVFSHHDGDLELCEKILKEQLLLYPNGVWFLFFKGRLELTKGNLDDAQAWYEKSMKSQNVWPQFHHLCFWEIMWAYAGKFEWVEAAGCADRLLQESKWSRTIYSYQKAALLLMQGRDMTDDHKAVVDQLMKSAPDYRQRLAGKSIPMEKFVVKRANRYFAQKGWLCLPGVELMYLWSFFKSLSKNRYLLRNVLNLVKATLEDLPDHGEYAQDNRSLLMLLKGVCLRCLTMYLQAEECFQYVIDNGRKLKEDTFLVPYAVFELALVHIEQKNYPTAAAYLNDAKKNYTGYSLESRLHFKIHSASNLLIEEGQTASQTSLESFKQINCD